MDALGDRKRAEQAQHSSTTNTSGKLNLIAGTRYSITVEYFDADGQAEARLRWLTPGNSSYVAVPASQLFAE